MKLIWVEAAQACAAIDSLKHIGPAGSVEVFGAAAAIDIDTLSLGPVTLMLVIVGSDRYVEGVANVVAVAENLLLVLGFNIVERGDAVAPVQRARLGLGLGTERE